MLEPPTPPPSCCWTGFDDEDAKLKVQGSYPVRGSVFVINYTEILMDESLPLARVCCYFGKFNVSLTDSALFRLGTLTKSLSLSRYFCIELWWFAKVPRALDGSNARKRLKEFLVQSRATLAGQFLR